MEIQAAMATPVESSATVETKVSTLGGCSFIFEYTERFQNSNSTYLRKWLLEVTNL